MPDIYRIILIVIFFLLLLLLAFFRGLCSARPLIRSTTFLFQSTVKVFLFFFSSLTLERDAVELVAKPIKQFERTNQNRCNTLGRPPRSFICVHFSYRYFFFFLSISIHFLKGIFEGYSVQPCPTHIHTFMDACVRVCFRGKLLYLMGASKH